MPKENEEHLGSYVAKEHIAFWAPITHEEADILKRIRERNGKQPFQNISTAITELGRQYEV